MARNYGERLGKMRNFLATDEVPKTLFGIPIVSNPDEYTDADLAFFRKNPEAGGYYDLGSEDPWEATPDDGTDEGAPVQDDEPKTGGRTGEHSAQSSAPGFERAENAVKLLAKRLLAEVPGGTLIPAVARQREIDERARFEEWYKALPQGAKDEFKTLYFESGIWNPELLDGARAEFDRTYVMPGGDTERRRRMVAETVATMGAGRIATVGRDLTRTKWFADLAREYGTQDARAAVDLVQSEKFRDFFWQGNPEKVVADAAQYRKVSDIIAKLGGDPDTGRALVGGSASINKWGTIKRNTAISHDLDINSYGAGASKVPWQPTVFVRTADGGEAPLSDWWYDRFVAPLERPGFVENAPILDRIRRMYPDTHGNAPVLSWERGHKLADADYRYQEGVFRRIGYEPNVTAQAGANQFIGTRINGTPVDIFIADHRIDSIPGSPYAPAETAFGWKRAYAAENAQRGLPPRPKDVADMEMYRPFSAENPVVDPNTGRAQFSPSNFGDTILTDEGLPAVHNVETYPGSGEAVPMMMNTKGEMIYPFDPRVLQQDNMGGKAGGVAKKLRRQAGAAGEVADAGIAWLERQAKQTADMDVPVLSTAAKILQPAYVGARAAIAKLTSGGGKYYQPEVRDERYFSKDALREMAGNLARHGGRNMTRFGYTGLGDGTGAVGNAAAWEASQSVGGASVRGGKIIDKFDVDSKDPYGISDGAHLANEALGRVVDAGHRALGAVFGDENDPDAGKVRTEIPVEAIEDAVKGGK